MLCHKLKTIFVHIPKTGGQSVETVFLDQLGLGWDERSVLLLRGNDDPKRGPRALAHLTAAEYTLLGYLDKETFDSYFKFSVVRNTWDRLFSLFKRSFARKCSFEEFINKYVSEENFTDHYNRGIFPQDRFILDDEGRLMIDLVIPYDELSERMGEVIDRLSLNGISLKHLNSSPPVLPGSYREYYTPQMKNRISLIYKREIELWEFEF